MLALDQTGEHVAPRIARAAPALGDQLLEQCRELADRIVATRQLLRGRHWLQDAEDGK
jgi:hypothetical protein